MYGMQPFSQSGMQPRHNPSTQPATGATALLGALSSDDFRARRNARQDLINGARNGDVCLSQLRRLAAQLPSEKQPEVNAQLDRAEAYFAQLEQQTASNLQQIENLLP